MNIFIDLDGTILDIEKKYNRLFSLLRDKYKLRNSNYWGLRSSGVGLSDALLSLGISIEKIDEFKSEWARNVEEAEMLSLDTIIDGAHAKLTLLGASSNLVLCTARANADNLNAQLISLNILDLFSSVLLVPSGVSKSIAVSSYYETNEEIMSSEDWIIGDTLEDIQAGNSIGIKTCGVLTGLATVAIFKEARASQVCDSLAKFNFKG